MTTARTRPPGMVDVAALAGVSYQTVSRVVNGHPSVAIDTRQRVEAAIKQLNFRPNGAARALVTGRGTTICVFASSTTLYGYAGTLEGIEQAARLSGLTTMITVLDLNTPDEVAHAVRQVLTQPLAGVIVLTHDEIGNLALNLVPPSMFSVGVGGSGSATHPHAVLDERSGAAAATNHLLELGHRTVHHVAIPSETGVSQRAVGWSEALRAVGAEVPEALNASWLPRAGYDAGLQLGERGDVTTMLAGNDDLAVGVVRGIFDSGRRVPEDVSVIGFDDQPFTEFLRPALTTVRQSFPELGRTAVAMLREQFDLEVGSRQRVLLATELIVRESTAPPPST
ncbi:MAG: LacI family DNA-binding transcriptional regulator [Propionibacteriaceae bacterium]